MFHGFFDQRPVVNVLDVASQAVHQEQMIWLPVCKQCKKNLDAA